MARREVREYREYLREEQRSQPGCPAREVVLDQRGRATRRSFAAREPPGRYELDTARALARMPFRRSPDGRLQVTACDTCSRPAIAPPLSEVCGEISHAALVIERTVEFKARHRVGPRGGLLGEFP